MSDITRRAALGQLAGAFAVAGAIDRSAAAAAHEMVAQAAAAGTMAPKALSVDQFRTLERLTDFIVPPDGNKPGAVQVGVPAWIDALLAVNAELKSRYVAGLAWLDTTMMSRHGSGFAGAALAPQTALLDQIAFPKNRTEELTPGIEFFTLARRMTVDGFYTSPVGMRDIYLGNMARTEFTVPKEAVDYVLSRSPFK